MATVPGMVTPRRSALGVSLSGLAAAPGPAGVAAAGRNAAIAEHVVLLGDSIFDNQAYVRGGPDVLAHLRAHLPAGWRATLAAVDGSVASSVPRQLGQVPQEAIRLFVSAGGNDALRSEGALGEAARSFGEALARLSNLVERFREDYRAMLEAVLARGLPTALCTIYDPRFSDALRQRLAITGLALFNDMILREAFRHGLPVIDLRLVCSEAADFANPIGPSVQGGRKIAAAITRLAVEHNFQQRRATIYTEGA
jgi:hypothetical protein